MNNNNEINLDNSNLEYNNFLGIIKYIYIYIYNI